ncbi:hypothetical protein GUJ93_ZPchr0009g2222 [Zizania palustris]|uniref:Uncharacterized protein n=1 Tax=Zizania palustris TaxID=103762 RepID=A0A8J5RRW9_ZIZPA|nr:hypothetical protein GUJ93_ZPchr0009g2222 [Zizania palustris]
MERGSSRRPRRRFLSSGTSTSSASSHTARWTTCTAATAGGSDGGLMFLRLGPTGALVVSSAAAAADLFKHHDLAFASRPPNCTAERLFYGDRNISFAPYGDGWRRAKKLAVVHLLSTRRAASSAPARAAEAAGLVARARRAAEAGQAVPLRPLLYGYTNGVITRVAASGSGETAERWRTRLSFSWGFSGWTGFRRRWGGR